MCRKTKPDSNAAVAPVEEVPPAEEELADEDWLNFNRPAGAPVEIKYPIIQWWNGGAGDSKHTPSLFNGGWELPEKHFLPIFGDSLETYDVPHTGNTNGTEPAYLFQTLHIAVVMTHVSYYSGPAKKREWYTDFVQGRTRSYVRLLAFVKEIEEVKPLTPVVLTFHSTTAGDYFESQRAFQGEVLARADQIAARINARKGLSAPDRFMAYAFWMPLGATGKREKTGSEEQSFYAPVRPVWDREALAGGDVNAAIVVLKGLATPNDLRLYITDHFYEEAQKWYAAQQAALAKLAEQTAAAVAIAGATPPPPVMAN